MKLPLLPPRGIFVVTALLFDQTLQVSVKETLMQILAMAWSSPRHETPPLTFSQLASLTGKSLTTLYGHIAVLRNYRAALRSRHAGHGTLVITLAEWLYTNAQERRPEEDVEKSSFSKIPENMVNNKENQQRKIEDSSLSSSVVLDLKAVKNFEKIENGVAGKDPERPVEGPFPTLSAKVTELLMNAGIYRSLFNEVAMSGLGDEDLLALLAWCEADYPERPGGLFVTRLRAGAEVPERFYGERCDVCGKTNGHSDTCRRRYLNWQKG